MGPQMWLHCRMAEKMEMYKYRERPSRMEIVQAIAKRRGDNVSEVIRDALKDYVREHQHELPGNRSAEPQATAKKNAATAETLTADLAEGLAQAEAGDTVPAETIAADLHARRDAGER